MAYASLAFKSILKIIGIHNLKPHNVFIMTCRIRKYAFCR
jgi:hypothetical protein